MKDRLQSYISRTRVGHRAIEDRRYRVLLFCGASLSWNFVYGVYNGVLGVMYGSARFAVLCAYYFILCVMRVSVMPLHRRADRDERTVMRNNGAVLILLALALAVTVPTALYDPTSKPHDTITMIGIAVYTFYIAIHALVNSVKAYKEKSALLLTIRNISLAAATASMLSLERSMVSVFGSVDTRFARVMHISTGAGCILIVALLGVAMLLGARNYPSENPPDGTQASAAQKNE